MPSQPVRLAATGLVFLGVERRTGLAVFEGCQVSDGRAPGRQNEKIPILGEDNPPEIESSLQEPLVIPVGIPILGDGQNIDLELPQAISYRRGHMMIQIKGQAHADSLAFRSFVLAGDGSCRDAIRSTSLN